MPFPQNKSKLTRRGFASGVAAAAFAPSIISAQESAFAKLALDAGPQRAARILHGAKQEGTVSVYGSGPVDDMAQIFSDFEARYGVRVRYWRAGPQALIGRTLTEYRAGRFDVDVIKANGPIMEAVRREKILHEVASDVHADLLPQAVPHHREWVGMRLNIIVGAYNTKLVQASSLPAAYDAFAHESWRGRIAVEAGDFDWFAMVVGAMGEAEGLETFRRIGRTAGFDVRRGHSLLATLVAAGEIPLSLNTFSYKLDQLMSDGAPIAPLVLPPAVARVNGIGVARRPAHPNAALLFYEHMLSHAQAGLVQRWFTPTNVKVQPRLSAARVELVDPVKILDEADKWRALWAEIINLRP